MRYDNCYFINGTAYAGKSTMLKMLAEKYNGILCEENYHDALANTLDKAQFPCLTYTRDLADFHDFIRRTPEEYERWIRGVTKECETIELRILDALTAAPENAGKKIFVDTNITIETLREISDKSHVLFMITDPSVSVRRFFERPDREKQYLYRLLLEEKDPQAAMDNFRECLRRVNSQENYDRFKNAGFPVLVRDGSLTLQETFERVEQIFALSSNR